MGQAESDLMVDENTPCQTLDSRSIDGVAKFIKDGHAKKIVVMTGAGISTSAGIPDFRSPDTGLYANLARLNLPYAEAVFDISYFRNNPLPFYTLAQELYPGKYRPTITHSFINLLHEKGLLLKLFTQNIDCLEREAGVPGDKIVEAHGSFATHSCIECKAPYPNDLMDKAVASKTVPHCEQPSCDGLVKPDIVFFGEALPSSFFANRQLPGEADLAIVMGTSLSVQPFASLPTFCAEGTPRVLINQEQVGGLGSRPDDVLVLGDCDGGVRKLAEALGWLEELEEMWVKTKPTYKSHINGKAADSDAQPKKSRDEQLEEEVEKLTKEVENSLKLGEQQYKWLENHVGTKFEQIQEKDKEKEADKVPAVTGSARTEYAEEKGDGAMAEADFTPAKGSIEDSRDDGGGALGHVFPFLDGKKSSS